MTTPTDRRRAWRCSTALTAFAVALMLAAPAAAQTAQTVDIKAGDLDAALIALAAQTHSQVVYGPGLVAGRKTAGVSGTMTVEQAIARLAPDFTVSRASPTVVVVKALKATPARLATPAEAPEGHPFGGEAAPTGPADAAPLRLSDTPAAGPAPTSTVSAIEVTGTHIRGAGLSISPLKTLEREDLDRLGQFTLAEALTTLPQNFAGQNTETSRVTTDRLGNNTTYSVGVNLRGLGSGATLVLVNGRRLGGAGVKGDFTDISTLPSIAVARADLLLDGASAIYGSDAVGGVVNILMRRDFEGLEVRGQAGQADGGSLDEEQVGVIGGRTWSGGGVVAAYELYRRSALLATDRSYAASSDLRPFGGTDFRSTLAFPGNIVAVNPATGLSGPFFGVPANQGGVGLTAANFTGGSINLENQHRGLDLLPDQQRQSAYIAAHQAVGDRIELSGEALYGFRAARVTQADPTSTFTVTKANPFFFSPIGASTESFQYSFDQLPFPVARNTEETVSVTGAANIRLWGDWRSDSFLSFSQEIEEARFGGAINSTILAEALGNVADRPTTAYSPSRDGFFNPFTALPTNTPAVLAAIGSGFTYSRVHSTVYTASTQADGTLFQGPGGPVKLAVGGQFRRETFDRFGSSYTSTVAPVAIAGAKEDRTVGAVFGELRAPLVGTDNARPGIQALEFSAALRWEHYSDFGGTTNPKIGVLWTPVEGLNLRSTFGRSFRAPGLRELHDLQSNTPIALPSGAGGSVETLVLQGGNVNLRPETADSFTAGFDWRPRALGALRVSVTGYDIRYQHRIDIPVASVLGTALTDPTVASFVQRLNPSNPTDLATITALLASPQTTTALGVFPPAAFAAIVDARYVNTGKLEVEGVDLEVGDSFTLPKGRLDLNATASDLLRYNQQLTPTGPTLSRVALAGFPARLHARLTADWSDGPLTLGAAFNHTSAFHDAAGAHVSPLETVDLQARWVGPPDSRWTGLTVALNVRNLFNADPPFYNSPLGFAFDGANAEVIGRFVALQLTRRW